MKKISVQSMNRQFRRLFSEARLNGLGKRIRFCARERCVTPQRLALSMIDAFAGKPLKAIADIQRSFNAVTGRKVQYKPFHNQLAKPQFPLFMQELLTQMMNDLAVDVLRFSPESPFARFQRILLQDGTSFAVKHTLRKHFPGRFTTTSPAAVELHVTLDLLTEGLQTVMLAPDSLSERQFLPEPHTLAESLLLADRGYFDKAYCVDTALAQGAFIIRGQTHLNPLILGAYNAQGEEIKCWRGQTLKAVRHKIARHRAVDLDVQFRTKQGRFDCRLIANPNPREDAPRYLVTNLARSDFNVDHISDAYRLRWQIELLFKEWKSYLNLHRFDTRNQHIATGLIWAALCAAVLSRYCAHITQRLSEKPISTRRVAMCLPHVMTKIIDGLLGMSRQLTNALQYAVDFLANNAQRAHPKRDKKTGRHKLDLQPVYGDA